MSEFQPIYPETINLDPYKRVKYSNGLVLGKDEFDQEQLYLLEKNHLHHRGLHGYGTVCGLNVSVIPDGTNWEIQVSPGIAVDTGGRDVRVPQAQCADVGTWLFRNTDIINDYLVENSIPASTVPIELPLHLVLCYDSCDTDFVPVPSGPCQSLDKSTVPSRTADDFKLRLLLEPPEQTEHDALAFLMSLLDAIEVSDAPGGLTVEEIEEIVRAFEPPGDSLHMNAADAADIIAAALRVWVTEVRPGLLPDGRNCVNGPPLKTCMLLGRVDLNIELASETELGFMLFSPSIPDPTLDPSVDQSNRPLLIQTRALQEFVSLRLAALQASDTVMPSAGLDPLTLVHIGDAETITGQKTFSQPLLFEDSGVMEKTINLPAVSAHHGTGAAKGLFASLLPSLHFMTSGSNAFGGEALFAIPIPDDIDYDSRFRVRLHWGFSGNPQPADIEFNWQVGGVFFEPGDSAAGATVESVDHTSSEEDVRRNDVLVTEFFELDPDVELRPEHTYGMLTIRIEDPGDVISQVYLLNVEIRYMANRLGRDV